METKIIKKIKFYIKTFLFKLGYQKYHFPYRYTAKTLDVKLWGGFSKDALIDLELLKNSTTAIIGQRINAAINLSKWHVFIGDNISALKNIEFAHSLSKDDSVYILMIYAEILNRLGKQLQARSLINSAFQKGIINNDLILMYANTFNNHKNISFDNEILNIINLIYRINNLAPIKKKDVNTPLNFYNITAELSYIPKIIDGPKISVIIPSYNSESSIKFVIQSLLDQTWQNFEIIVVDDMSTDSSFEIVSEIAKQDQRVIPIRQSKNMGAYAARNTGLINATGEYITINDSDDWAHPQKLEYQVRSLLFDYKAKGTITYLARIDERIYFTRGWKIGNELIRENQSSFMFHKKILTIVGGWDKVRVSADSEFIERIRHVFGRDAIKIIKPEIPFTFCLDLTSNLTKKSESHLKTLYFGKRSDYTEMARWWRNNTIFPNLKLNTTSEGRPFQAPDSMKIKPDGKRDFDFFIITDFSLNKDANYYAINFIRYFSGLGKRIAIFHYPNYESLKMYRKPLQNEIYKLINNKSIDRISNGESLTTDYIIFFQPGLLNYQIDSIPNIKFNNLLVVADEAIPSLRLNIDEEDQPGNILFTLNNLFGTTGKWITTSELIKTNLSKITDFPPVLDFIWYPSILYKEKSPKVSKHIYKYRDIPTIGFIGFSSINDYPLKRRDLLTIYCAKKQCNLIIYEQSQIFFELIKNIPQNWSFISSSEMNPSDFLSQLDFYIYFPGEIISLPKIHEVIEALSMGCVVISSHQYQNFFSDAVLYAKPKEVWITIQQYWNDKDLYNNQRQKGIDFVKTRCNFDNLRTIFEE